MSNHPDPYDVPRTKQALKAANDSARLFRTIFVSHVVITLYLLVIGLSADDQLLFMDDTIQAPILNLHVQASHFFIAAPWILFLLHVNLMIHGVLLAGKIRYYRASIVDEDAEQSLLQLLLTIPSAQMAVGASSGVPLLLLRFFVFVTWALLPLITIGIMQAQFLDFQDGWITGIHSMALVLDCLLVLLLWPKVEQMCFSKSANPGKGWPSLLACAVTTVFIAIAYAFSPPVRLSDSLEIDKNSPSAESATGDGLLRYLERRLEALHSLNVQDRRLYRGAEVIAPSESCADNTVALNLANRSFKHARLARSVLCNANFRNAKLDGARMEEAMLRGVRMDSASLVEAHLDSAQLQGADLTDADLTDATLVRAQLEGAVLADAKLSGAELGGHTYTGLILEGRYSMGQTCGTRDCLALSWWERNCTERTCEQTFQEWTCMGQRCMGPTLVARRFGERGYRLQSCMEQNLWPRSCTEQT